MKTIVTRDGVLETVISDNPADAKIAFCDEHHDALMARLKEIGIDTFISANVEELRNKLQSGRVDPLFHATDALIRLSLSAMGSEEVVKFRCPVCAFKQFDFITQAADLMKQLLMGKLQ